MSDLTPEESRLVEELGRLVDHVGRVLVSGLDSGPHYIAEKAAALKACAEDVERVADLAVGAGVRMDVVADRVRTWSQHMTAGRLLYPNGGVQ